MESCLNVFGPFAPVVGSTILEVFSYSVFKSSRSDIEIIWHENTHRRNAAPYSQKIPIAKVFSMWGGRGMLSRKTKTMKDR